MFKGSRRPSMMKNKENYEVKVIDMTVFDNFYSICPPPFWITASTWHRTALHDFTKNSGDILSHSCLMAAFRDSRFG